MTTGPDGERRQEPTFADVMNGFGLDSGRPVRRWASTPPPPPPMGRTARA